MKLTRIVLRLAEEVRQRLDDLRVACAKESARRVSRGHLLRLIVDEWFATRDTERPLLTPRPPKVRAPGTRSSKRASPQQQATVSLRQRLVQEIEARPGEVLGARRLMGLVKTANHDSVRNALLVLATRKVIEKVGLGQYRARRKATTADPLRGAA